MGINFGYIRLSTNVQNLNRQLKAIIPYITDEKYLYIDRKDLEREGFQNMLKAMRDGAHCISNQLIA